MIEIPAAKVERAMSDKLTILIPELHRDAWLALAGRATVKASRQLYVKLGPPRKPRTTGWKSQCNHTNGHVQQIAAHTGDSFDDVKMHIKREAISAGYPMRTTSWGEAVPVSESDASTVDAAILIETAHRIASMFDIRLQEGDE